MTLRRIVYAIALFVLVVATVIIVVPTSTAAMPNQKISARVLDETANGGTK